MLVERDRRMLQNVDGLIRTFGCVNILETAEEVMTNLLNVGFDAGWAKKIK